MAGAVVGGDDVGGEDVGGDDVAGEDVAGDVAGVVLGATEPVVWSAAGEDSPHPARVNRAAVPEMST